MIASAAAADALGNFVSRRVARLTAALTVALLLFVAAPASASTVTTHPFLKSFDGSGSKSSSEATGPFESLARPGPYQAGSLAIDESTGDLYVPDQGYGGVLDRFNAVGEPAPYSSQGPGVNSLSINEVGAVAIDNSGTSTQGQIWLEIFSYPRLLQAYDPTGAVVSSPNLPLHNYSSNGLATDSEGNVWWGGPGGGMAGYNSGGSPLNREVATSGYTLAIDSSHGSPTSNYFYSAGVDGYNAAGTFLWRFEPTQGYTSGIAVDPGNHHIYVVSGLGSSSIDDFAPSSDPNTPPALVTTFGGPDPGHGFPGLCGNSRGIAVNGVTHDIYVTDCNHIDIFGPGETYIIPNAATDPADHIGGTSATLHGHVETDEGGDITNCHFEYGTTTAYGTSVPCSPPPPIHDGEGNVAVSAEVANLESGVEYHFRVVASNVKGTATGADRTFKPQGPPEISDEYASDVNTDKARIHAIVDPVGAETSYRVEIGTDTGYGTMLPVPDAKIATPTAKEAVEVAVPDLLPGTVYHYRVVATNEKGTTYGTDQFFKTFAPYPEVVDHCPNALVRKQTGASLLLDCRAYELVSAANAGGYDVQSDLIPGQAPPLADPQAPNRVLYSLHYGIVPGVAGSPTNFGLDPYIATRKESGWSTRYVGLSADGTPSTRPFGSPLREADAGLSTFAFGGQSLCEPCFEDGSTGIPLRLPDGELVQGMKGSLDPGPTAKPEGFIGRSLSADGSHLLFGSKSQFEPDGNSNGDISIYDRNLATEETRVVSKAPGGPTMTGAGIGELDVSADGSRVVVGQKVSTDSQGNVYWHLYMNLGDSSKTVDLTPGTTGGVLYDGMTADGSKVFFTTADKLTPEDKDESPDIYEAEVSGESVSLHLISKGNNAGNPGEPGNSDACNPAPGIGGPHWNAVGATASCGAVALRGGSGVASGDGTIFFLSPEQLDGNGAPNQPNLFVVRPGAAPHFLATLSPGDEAVAGALANNAVRDYASFQITPNGQDALFASHLPLTGFPNRGHSEIYRYDSGEDELACPSCAGTNAAAATDTTLSRYGLNLSDDGRVFFTSAEQLVLRDTNKAKDVYEWSDGRTELISTGSDSSGAALLSVSSNGVDALFFTRQVLVAQDGNGSAMKIYDAREDGGFPTEPPRVPCQASDECHGPGTQAAPPPQIGTFKGTGGNVAPPSSGHHQKQSHHHHKRHHKRHNRHPRRRHG